MLMKSVPKIWNPVVLPRNRWTEGGGRSIWRTKAGSVKGMTEVQAGSFVPKNDVEMCRWEEMSTGLMPKRTHTSLHGKDTDSRRQTYQGCTGQKCLRQTPIRKPNEPYLRTNLSLMGACVAQVRSHPVKISKADFVP